MAIETVERGSKQPWARPAGIVKLLTRVESEYYEMPGLKLTEAQARRLWNLDETTCGVVLSMLTARGFLKRTARGTYIRASS